MHDPAGRNTPADIARKGGACFRIDTARGSCHVVFRREQDTLWIDGAASDDGRGLSPLVEQICEGAARVCGCRRLRLETQRRGYVRLGALRGWRVAAVLPYTVPAYVLEKELPWTC